MKAKFINEAIKHLSGHSPEDIVKFMDPNEALRWASQRDHIEIVKLLLDAGANIHANDDSALRWASEDGSTEIVKLLLDAGADVHARDDFSLRWASQNGHIEIVKLLLDAGADVHVRDDYALRWASQNGHTKIVKLLKQHKNIDETIKHLTGKSDEELKKHLHPSIISAYRELQDRGIKVSIHPNQYNGNIIEFNIPGIDDHQISYLPYEDREWQKFGPYNKNYFWGWGIYELDGGIMIVDGTPGDWKDARKFILKKLKTK